MSQLYEESYRPGVGRVLVAVQDIAAGQTVLQDHCLVATPDGLPVCLGCLAVLPPHHQVDCPRCQWPLCSDQCQASPDHALECQIFSDSKMTPKTCGALSLWYITAVIRSRLRLDWVTGGDVEHVYGVLKTNGVGAVSQGARACYLYPVVSLMSHSCLPNTLISSSPAKQITFVAATDIPAGSELSWCYSNILYSRQQRQDHLASTWMFDCQCERCRDPTELGLHYSHLQCPQCPGHFTLITPDSLASLTCSGCQGTIERAEASISQQNLLKTISALQPQGVKDFLSQLSEDSRYHKTHHVVTRASIRQEWCDGTILTQEEY